MTQTDVSALAPSVAQRFKEAVATLEMVSERWSALATVEEQEALASEALTTAASQVTEMSRTMASNCEATKEATAALLSVISAASMFLEGNDLIRLRTEVEAMRQDLETMCHLVSDTLTAQLQQAMSERDEVLSEADSSAKAHTEIEDKFAVLEQEHADLKAKVEQLPKRMKNRLEL